MRPWSDRVIGVSSLSKAWGTPGIRIGWLATRDAGLYETRLAAKKQIVVANSIVDETIALAALEGHDRWLPRLREGVLTARDNVAAWIDDSPFEWIPPGGGAVGFRRVRPEIDLDVDRFYASLFEDHGTVVGPGYWFEQPRRNLRLGFGWPTPNELAGGAQCPLRSRRRRAALTSARGGRKQSRWPRNDRQGRMGR